METFHIRCFPVQKERVLHYLRENGISYNAYAETYFAHPAFITEIKEETDICILTLQELGFPEGATFSAILEAAKKRGYLLAKPADAFYLRLLWSEQDNSTNSVLSGKHEAPQGAVTVFCKPLTEDDSFPKGLYLRKVDDICWLRGYTCDDLYLWPADTLIAFRKA